MNRTIIAFIVLVVMLFLGIGILMNPSILVTYPGPLAEGQTADNNPAIKSFITLGSAFLLVGLVGLAVLGFIMAGRAEPQESQAKT
jgi:presenilin-like A22 family membrane protease